MEICLGVAAWVGYLCCYFCRQEKSEPVPDLVVAGAGGERGDGRGWGAGAGPPLEEKTMSPRQGLSLCWR